MDADGSDGDVRGEEEEEERRMRMMRWEGEENYSSEGPLASCCLIMRLIEMRTTFDRRAVFAG